MTRRGLWLCLLLLTPGCHPGRDSAEVEPAPREAERLRLALFNIRELSTEKLLDVDDRGVGQDVQLRAAANIVQRVRPDVLVLNEIDHDYNQPGDLALNARRFQQAYLGTGEEPLTLEHAFAAPNNTGLLSGVDLDGDGHTSTIADLGDRRHGNDSFGYGTYPGQYSMAVLSRVPFVEESFRAFQTLRWRDVPGNHMPDDTFSSEATDAFRLSSKSHWDLPLQVGQSLLHLWLSHPTPPGFDGPEDKNGRRNFDEIGLWAHYLNGAPWLVDDAGTAGGSPDGALFVIAGDLNAAPDSSEPQYDGQTAISQLLDHPLVHDPGALLVSDRPLEPSQVAESTHPERATAVFGGGVRIDYLLPSRALDVIDGGVFWPHPERDPQGAAWAEQASDHRLLWLDLRLP